MHERKLIALSCWKDIAAYLNCGVRTAQRWETSLGLPVRRPGGGKRQTVYAVANELDAWRLSWQPRELAEGEIVYVAVDPLNLDLSAVEVAIKTAARDGKTHSVVVTLASRNAVPPVRPGGLKKAGGAGAR